MVDGCDTPNERSRGGGIDAARRDFRSRGPDPDPPLSSMIKDVIIRNAKS